MNEQAILAAIDAMRAELDKIEAEAVGEASEAPEAPEPEGGMMGGGKMPMPMPGE